MRCRPAGRAEERAYGVRRTVDSVIDVRPPHQDDKALQVDEALLAAGALQSTKHCWPPEWQMIPPNGEAMIASSERMERTGPSRARTDANWNDRTSSSDESEAGVTCGWGSGGWSHVVAADHHSDRGLRKLRREAELSDFE